MAKFRNVSVKFWSDPFVESLTPEKKYFFLYLITNEHSSQCGIYEISFRQMSFETGYNQETIEKLVAFFEKSGKVKYSKKTNEIAIKNFIKHNPQGSPKVKAFVEKELKGVKDRLLIGYVYAIDTLSQQEEEQEEEQTKEETPQLVAAKAATLDDRYSEFMQKLTPYVEKYGKEMLREFFDYWTEKNDGGRKFRFEMQKVFDIEKRLRTWSKNQNKFGSNGTSKNFDSNKLTELIKSRNYNQGTGK